VPFFLEELVKSLRETGAIEEHADQWRLKPGDIAIPVPDTVEEVLTARIDRLPEGAKSLLQLGAVIGREFGCELLREVSGLPEREFTTSLTSLTDAELLYARGVPPQTVYVFKHAFTQEAAYRSVLTARRQDLHQRIAMTLEALFPDRLEEYYGQLAHHYGEALQGDAVARAVEYARRAGERYMTLPAYAEAARFYHMALEALARQTPVDETQRCLLLLRLGEAQRKAGETLQALDTLQRAADTARGLGAAEHFAHAALEFEQTTWRGWQPAAPTVRLLEEARQALGESDSALQARTLGSLARALLYASAQGQAAADIQQVMQMVQRLGKQAVKTARRVGDPGVLAFTLGVMRNVPWRPEETEGRLTDATEMLHFAEMAGNGELVHEAHTRRMECLLELGDTRAVGAEIDALMRLDEELRQPTYLLNTIGYRAMLALLEGRFAAAEQLAIEALTLGQRIQHEASAGIFGVQMFTLRREQGRLREVEPAVRHFVQQHGTASTWRPGLALIYRELGRQREARVAFEHLAQHDFTDLPRDSLWAGCLTYLAEVCTFLGDTRRAATLYQHLLPYAGRVIVMGAAVVCYGAASRYLGLLATTLAHWDEAEQHFADALDMNARMGARPWLAHTQHDYATMLLRRSQPGDHKKATALLDVALATARELGMRALEARLTGQLEQPPPPAPAPPDLPDPLSPREVEVLCHLAAGKSNRDIADALCISLNTVATHVRNILTKTGCSNRTEAAAYALRHGLTTGEAIGC
jgi:DNA-binding CsgD family transcriptional regulator